MNFINIISNIINSNENLDFLKNTSEIPKYYKNLINIFLKMKFYILSSHQNHLNHHISSKKNIKLIFNSIYNILEIKFKVLKNNIEEILVKS